MSSKSVLAASIIAILFLTLVFAPLQREVGSAPSETESPPSIQWSQTYGGVDNELGFSVVQTGDGGYAFAGRTNSFGAGGSDFWLVRTDAHGNTIWSQTYGGSGNDVAYSIVQTFDGGFALAGYTGSYGAGGSDFWLVKTDAGGNTIWSRTYGGVYDDEARSVIQTSDGGYAIAGKTNSIGAGGFDFWVIKTDSSGNIQWRMTYGGPSDDAANTVIQTADGGYAVGGWTTSYGAGSGDFWVVKTDSNGIPLWNKTYGGGRSEELLSMVQTGDGGYTLAGGTHSYGAGNGDFWLVKTDTFGNVVWSNAYGGLGYDEAQSLVQTADGGYAMAGWTNSTGAGGYDSWLVKTDGGGAEQFDETFGGAADDEAFSLVQISDQGYAIAGTTYSHGAGGSDFWLVKTGPWQAVTIVSVTPYTTIPTPYSGIDAISVQVQNTFDVEKMSSLIVYVDNTPIGNLNVTIPAHSVKEYTVQWNPLGYAGAHTLSAQLGAAPKLLGPLLKVLGIGYFIIVAGSRSDNDKIDVINAGCNKVYKTLLALGISKDRIYYMCQSKYGSQDVDGDGYSDVSALATKANLQAAIETWALGRVGSTEPLLLYLFDHGGTDSFCIDPSETLSSSTELGPWLDFLQSKTSYPPIRLIYAACEAGSFINTHISKTDRVIATSSSSTQNSGLAPDGTWEAFSEPFWNSVLAGDSVATAFNTACSKIPNLADQTPLLDDNGDGTGHTSSLPNGGDGKIAQYIYIGRGYLGSVRPPWPELVAPAIFKPWPPPEVLLWAKIKNTTSLSHVRAWMLPPDFVPSNNTDVLQSYGVESYEMTCPLHDGNWTVNIPAANFTNHAYGPSNFIFFVTAEDAGGFVATPSTVNVQFTSTGNPPPDTVPPVVQLEQPLENRVVSGTINVNGTATDDVCLKRVQLYVDDALQGTLDLTPTSTSFFAFNLNTASFPNGNHTIRVNAYDKSDNSESQTATTWVQNSINDVAVTDVETTKTIIRQGSNSSIKVTVNAANHGSYTQNFSVSLYANSTLIGTQPVILASQNSATLTFALNTNSFAKGNYTISAYAPPVAGETNTVDNNFTGRWIKVTIVGDINGDGKVNLIDVFTVALAYGADPRPDGQFWHGTPCSSCPHSPNCDINNDGKINLIDYFTTALNYGQTG